MVPYRKGLTKSIADIESWPSNMSVSEFPGQCAQWIDARLMEDILFDLRQQSGVPMWPSQLERAHVRHENSGSQHSTHEQTVLSKATDFHVSTHERLLKVFEYLKRDPSVGGIGLYFDTNTPMFHVDLMEARGERLVWIRDKAGNYVYDVNGYETFYRALAECLN